MSVKIYAVTSSGNAKVYVGSTTGNLDQQLERHQAVYREYLRSGGRPVTPGRPTGIELLEIVSAEQLQTKLKHWIRSLNSVNDPEDRYMCTCGAKVTRRNKAHTNTKLHNRRSAVYEQAVATPLPMA